MCALFQWVIIMTNKDIIDLLTRCIEAIDYMDRISKLPDCNDCAISNVCMHAPKIGEPVRINCPLHMKVMPDVN